MTIEEAFSEMRENGTANCETDWISRAVRKYGKHFSLLLASAHPINKDNKNIYPKEFDKHKFN